jgi:hypothetical protein
MRQDFFLFIRIQVFDIHAAAIRTKILSLAAGVITGSIQLVNRPPPAAFLTFFVFLAHKPRLGTPFTRQAVFKPLYLCSISYYSQYHTGGQLWCAVPEII